MPAAPASSFQSNMLFHFLQFLTAALLIKRTTVLPFKGTIFSTSLQSCRRKFHLVFIISRSVRCVKYRFMLCFSTDCPIPFNRIFKNPGELQMNNRERFSSRLGFILISAGCAVGLGNVWRFPYITGQYGGAAFVLVYLIFLVLLGLPIMVMEFSVGRASQKSAARSFHVLEPAGTKWHLQGYACMAGNYLLMMFYTTVGGWMAAYIFKTLTGEFKGLDSDGVAAVFNDMLARPGYMTFWMVLVVLLSFFICSLGLQKGVERITKAMMSCLFLILLILCIRSVTLPGASEGLRFYLIPDFTRFTENGVGNTIFAAMGQAFFTLSLGIGAMAIFGSYIGKDHTLTGETINICLLDTLVAFLAGLIIFPSCFAFGVDPGQGPGLVFITLPNIFNQMVGGRIFGVLFFVFMTFAAQSTIIAVFENIISFSMDLFGTSRKKTVLINGIAIILLSLPCVFGFNIWSGFQPMGAGSTIQDLEDFIVSNNLLPLGSMVYLLFCTSRYGWGWKNYTTEANTGKGLKIKNWMRGYITYILPLIVLFIFGFGIYDKFFTN